MSKEIIFISAVVGFFIGMMIGFNFLHWAACMPLDF